MLNLSKLENVQDKGNSWIAACPACRKKDMDSSGNHLIIYKDTGKFGCVISQEKSHYKSIIELAGLDKNELQQEEQIKTINQEKQDKIYPESCLVRLLPIYDYWINRKISLETLREFKCGVAQQGLLRFYSVFPIYNNKNQICGFSGRFILDCEKYNKPKVKHIGRKKEWVYPLHLNKEIIREKREIILVEGISDLISLWSCGIKNSLCLFGVKISSSLINTLVSLNPQKIIIATNNELNNHGVGNAASEEIKNVLCKFFDASKIVIKLPPTKDINDLLHTANGEEQIKELYG